MSKLDQEITSLLSTLYTIQSEVGAKEAVQTAQKSGKKADRFMEIKQDMVERLGTIKDLLVSER